MPELIKTENDSFVLPIQKGTFNKNLE